MEYYLVKERNEVLMDTTTTWINLREFMLTERSHTQKTTYILHDYIHMEAPKREIYRDGK